MEEKEDYYKKNFIEIKPLGIGAFSTVFKASAKSNNAVFAVKKIPFKKSEKEKTLKEIRILSGLNQDYVVNYIDHWVEKNYYLNNEKSNCLLDKRSLLFKPENTLLLHMQTELCSMPLCEVITFLFDSIVKKNSITLRGFNIACEIFNQLLACLDYLHSHDPPIIHRDLKPENIMLTQGERKNCVKLVDFGLSTYHEFVDQSHTKYIGTKQYRANELNGSNYDTKADIYSLGVILELLFNIDHNRDNNVLDKVIDESKYEQIKKLALSCMKIKARKRPTCKEIINKKHVPINTLADSKENSLYDEIKSFFNEMYQVKFHDKFIDENYATEFDEHQILYNNSRNVDSHFGIVFSAKKKIDNKLYAIEKIKMIDKTDKYIIETLQMIKVWANLSHKFILQIHSSWVEIVDYNMEEEFVKFPTWHIQTELCELTLKQAFEKINDELDQRSQYSLSPVGLYLGTQIFSNITEGVRYLHTHTPPIAHGNLNLNTIFVTSPSNVNVIKISDYQINSRIISVPYTKEDILSLSDILQSLFTVNLTRYKQQNEYYLNIEKCFRSEHLYKKINIISRLYQTLSNSTIDENITIENVIEEVNNFVVPYESIADTLIMKYILTDNNTLFTKNLVSRFCFNIPFKIPNFCQENSEIFFEKWPLLKLLDKEILLKLKYLYILEKIEHKTLFAVEDKLTYVVSNEPLASNTTTINELSNIEYHNIVIGESHILCLTSTNKVMSFGSNDFGQLGNCTYKSNNIPELLVELDSEDIIDIKCSAYSSFALSKSGDVFSWGLGNCGQLGHNSTQNDCRPLKIISLNFKQVCSIACGYHHCLALSAKGEVYAWGNNECGQIGNGSQQNQLRPQKIKFDNKIKIKKICCGNYNSTLLTKLGSVYAIGFNKFGQFGTSSNVIQSKPIKISNQIIFTDIESSLFDNILVGLSAENKYYFWGNGAPDFPNEVNLTSFYDIFLLFSERKRLYQTIIRKNFANEQEFEALVQKLQVLNKNNEDLLSKISILTHINLREYYAVLVTTDDNVYIIRINQSIEKSNFIKLSNLSRQKIRKIYSTNDELFCITDDKKILRYRLTLNPFYQNFEKIRPNQICRCKDFLNVLCDSGKLYGIAKFATTELVHNDVKFISFSSGSYHFIAKTEDNQLLGWGRNNFGQLGINNVDDPVLPTQIKIDNAQIKKVCCGQNHTLFLSFDGDVYACGLNNFGQLGHGDQHNTSMAKKIELSSIRFVDIAATFCDDISSALSEDGKYFIWGLCEQIVSKPKITELLSFDAIFAKYSKHLFTSNQITFNYDY